MAADRKSAPSAKSGRPKVPGRPPNAAPKNQFDAAIRILVPHGRRAEIDALFAGRATYGQVNAWRQNKSAAPQWALDCVRRSFARYAELLPPAPAPIDRRALINAWRSKRAREIDAQAKKENGGN